MRAHLILRVPTWQHARLHHGAHGDVDEGGGDGGADGEHAAGRRGDEPRPTPGG